MMEEKTFFNGEWKAIEKLGEGSFGTVYKAEKSQYGVKTYSAIKQILIPQNKKEYSTLKSEGMTKSDIIKSYDNQVKKWVEEIQFLNQFKDNENIVSIEDFQILDREDNIGKIINIRMELLENIDDHVLEQTTTDKKVLKMALDILNALEDCEEKNVVHRDIKPDNVFRNSKGVYKLGDFGEAKNIEKTVSNMSKKGTENYMAPEIYKGERGSKSVDTYSLGIMLYKYFNNNRLPFLPDFPEQITFKDREDALYKRMSGEEMKPPVKATSEIARIILKACSYESKNRYKSAIELKKDIESVYKTIKKSVKLFDFQEEDIKDDSVKEDSIKEEKVYDKTVGVFIYSKKENKEENKETKEKNSKNEFANETEKIYITNTSSDKTKYDKAVGLFSKNDTIEINDKKQMQYPKTENINPKTTKEKKQNVDNNKNNLNSKEKPLRDNNQSDIAIDNQANLNASSEQKKWVSKSILPTIMITALLAYIDYSDCSATGGKVKISDLILMFLITAISCLGANYLGEKNNWGIGKRIAIGFAIFMGFLSVFVILDEFFNITV